MRILLTESDHGTADHAAQALEEAGHEVVRCAAPDAPSFPCTGLASGDCPLDDRVDVAVTFRAKPHPRPTPREMGVTCALRHHVPLVVAGEHGSDPFVTWATASVPGQDTEALLAAVDDAAERELPAHAAAAAEEARLRLGVDDVHATARRHGNGVTVSVHPPMALDDRRRETLGIQVAAAVRRVDRYTGVIDVAIGDGDD